MTDHTELTDYQLVQQSLRDPESFRFLIERYQAKLLRYIQRISKIPFAEAEDILQESFLSAYIHLRDVDPNIPFSSWIYRIAHNHTISAYRKHHVRPEGNQYDVDDTILERIADDTDLLRDVDLSQLHDHLRRIISQLDVRYREVIELKYEHDKSYDEIADIIQKPPGTVATLLSRAKKQMKTLIQQDTFFKERLHL
jgi:RNA polymerase sigma-70 factor (ECF subfamily)